jgi:hypothetical protein
VNRAQAICDLLYRKHKFARKFTKNIKCSSALYFSSLTREKCANLQTYVKRIYLKFAQAVHLISLYINTKNRLIKHITSSHLYQAVTLLTYNSELENVLTKMFGMILIAICIIYYLYKLYIRPSNLPPGPFPLPFIGNIHQVDINSPHKTINEWGKKYGGIYSVGMGQQIVVITDVNLIREALVKNGKCIFIFKYF